MRVHMFCTDAKDARLEHTHPRWGSGEALPENRSLCRVSGPPALECPGAWGEVPRASSLFPDEEPALFRFKEDEKGDGTQATNRGMYA